MCGTEHPEPRSSSSLVCFDFVASCDASHTVRKLSMRPIRWAMRCERVMRRERMRPTSRNHRGRTRCVYMLVLGTSRRVRARNLNLLPPLIVLLCICMLPTRTCRPVPVRATSPPFVAHATQRTAHQSSHPMKLSICMAHSHGAKHGTDARSPFTHHAQK